MSKNKKILGKWDFIFLLGESGAGKGTLVRNIMKYWLPNLMSTSMGDIFREKAKTDNEIKTLMDEGILINDSIVINMFHEFAINNHPGLIDGFPRNRQQVIDSIKLIKEMEWRVLVIDIFCDIEVIIERLLSRGRSDDKLSIMYKRYTDHKTLHPTVMEEINNRPDLFDVIRLNGNTKADIAFTNFILDVFRLVDMLYLYEFNNCVPEFTVEENETTINPAINRFICDMLKKLQENLDEKHDKIIK
ncbi:MAG: nucleoside monophosphate kinase [Oscillospiraceae bacterium]|nr:nucleoside monophosphate kinase [Oscillospiraceae bacterium]